MNKKITGYNVRVYGILINEKDEVLLSKENKGKLNFTKFPGGGHELGEGICDALNREFQEELNIDIEIIRHFYTTDFFQVSAFDPSEQLISIYYLVKSKQADTIKDGQLSADKTSSLKDYFFWKALNSLEVDELTYPIDQKVIALLIENY